MTGSGASVLMVIAPAMFRDEELNHPREAFIKGGAEVTVASTQTGALKGMLGHLEKVDKTLDDIAGINYDAVVVVGGGGAPAHLWENARLREIVQRHHKMGKVVAAICLSGVVLARAGILKGVNATVFKSDETMKAYRQCGVVYKDQPVVLSGKVVTGSGPAAAREFGRVILETIGSK